MNERANFRPKAYRDFKMYTQNDLKRWSASTSNAWWRADTSPTLRTEDFTDNARAVDVLLRYTSNGDHPKWIAEAILSGDTHAVAKLADLAQQLDARQPGRGQSYIDDVMQRLPSPYQQHATIRQSLSPDPRTPSEFEGSPAWPGRDAETKYVSETASYDHHDTIDGDEKKTGTYIWRTVGDSKVRSAHAERNGKTYSWDDPPEGGHPGEAPNCRCRAEDVKQDCEAFRWELKAAWERHDALHEPLVKAEADVRISEDRIAELESNLKSIWAKISAMAASLVKRPSPPGVILAIVEKKILEQQQSQTELKIRRENRTLASAKKKLANLKHKQENHRWIAYELEGRYKKCKNG